MHLSNTDEWQTIVMDLSFIKSYANPSHITKFTENWYGFRLGLASSSHIKPGTTFWVKWIAVFPNITEAMNYSYSLQNDR